MAKLFPLPPFTVAEPMMLANSMLSNWTVDPVGRERTSMTKASDDPLPVPEAEPEMTIGVDRLAADVVGTRVRTSRVAPGAR